jgi:LmbE family N-acetylglucosaminyl deacetylase
MTEEQIRVMVVTPHPDDAEIGAGGTIASWVKQGREVILVVCTNGDKGSTDPDMTSEMLPQIRHQEQMKAAKILGISEVIFLDYPDGFLEDTPEFRGELVRLIRKHRPDVVMTTDPYRRYIWHRDHRITGIATLDAIYPYARDRLCYPEHIAEGLEPHRVKEVYLWGSEELDTYIDVSDTFDIKMAALSCHASQVAPYVKFFRQRIKTRAEKVGQSEGVPLAEAFHRIEIIF